MTVAAGSLTGLPANHRDFDLPIAGVTPAEYMKNIGNTGLEQVARVPLTKGNLKTTTAGAKVAGASLNGSALTPGQQALFDAAWKKSGGEPQ